MEERKKRKKRTESLSIRLDPKTKFILDFVARVRGQSITTVVERAVKDAADTVTTGDGSIGSNGRNWIEFWDVNEGVRTLKLLSDPHYPKTYDEDELRHFTLANWPFFYTDSKGHKPKKIYVTVLWPKVEKYHDFWRETKSDDYWAAGEAMKADLVSARVEPPEWPSSSATAS